VNLDPAGQFELACSHHEPPVRFSLDPWRITMHIASWPLTAPAESSAGYRRWTPTPIHSVPLSVSYRCPECGREIYEPFHDLELARTLVELRCTVRRVLAPTRAVIAGWLTEDDLIRFGRALEGGHSAGAA
jgi:hypothetical protein